MIPNYQFQWGTLGTTTNNASHTVSLPTRFPSKNLVTITVATVHSHWATIKSKDISSIIIEIYDYGYATSSGAYWMSCGI